MQGALKLIKQAQDGDKNARDQFISENLGLVHAIVRRFEHRGHDREELFQIGCIGLMKAIDRFDLTLNLAFSTYAVPLISGEIKRFLRDDGMVKISRSLKENGYKVSKAKDSLSKQLGREASLLELSAFTELTTEEIIMAMDANREVSSIYQPVSGEKGEELLLIDQIGGEINEYDEPAKEAILNELVVEQLMNLLKEEEKKLIQLRYFENKTQCETAKKLGMSQVQVSRLERKILAKLREKV